MHRGGALPDAEFKLVKTGNGTDEYDATSDDEGFAEFTDIPDGTYTLYEYLAPYGYIKSDDTYRVAIDADGGGDEPITIEKENATVGGVQTTYEADATIATFVNQQDERKNVEITLKKTVVGDNAPAGKTFDFELQRMTGEDEAGIPFFETVDTYSIAPGSEVNCTASIPVNELGNMVIVESQGTERFWTYDETMYFLDISQSEATGEISAKYIKANNDDNTPYEVAEFVNQYDNPYGMDGVYHWPINSPNEVEEHIDEDADGYCDVCDYNMAGEDSDVDEENDGDENNGDENNDGIPGGDDNGGNTDNNGDDDVISGDDDAAKDATDKAAKTGDNSNLMLWTILMIMAVAAGTGTVLYRRKNTVK